MTSRLKPLRGEGAQLLKLLTTAPDQQTLQQGLELAESLGGPIEGLLDGVEVSGAGDLLPSSRFQGTRAMQPTLDAVLLHQLAMGPPGSREAQMRQAVRRLRLECHLVPHLRGFDALESLEVVLLPGAHWPDLGGWSPLPALATLTIAAQGQQAERATLASLQGLEAPCLQSAVLRELALADIGALVVSNQLRVLDLAKNPHLASIQALAPSAPRLESLDFEDCAALDSLVPLQGAGTLVQLNLKGCARVDSLEPLSASKALTAIDLEGCAGLKSLQGLVGQGLAPIRYSRLDLSGCSSLSSLRHLPPLSPKVDSLYLDNMPALTSLEGIEAASSIETLTLQDTAVAHLDHIAGLPALADLRVWRCAQLANASAIGVIATLKRAAFNECGKLRHLPPAWDSALERLSMHGCAIVALGQLPASLIGLEARDCPGLIDLRGVEAAVPLRELAVDTCLQDASAIAGLQEVVVRCFRHGTGAGTTAAWWTRVFGKVSPLRLDLRFAGLSDLQFLIGFENLRQAMVGQEAITFYGLKQEGYRNEPEVRTLQRAICKKHGIPAPPFLKPRRTSNRAAVPGGLSLADLKPGLTSTDFSQVLQALDRLRADGSPALYDELMEGVDPPNLYTGTTAPLGKMFKDIKAPYRDWARWAITRMLLDAPETAAVAASVRQTIQSMELGVDLRLGQASADEPPALSRFTGLRALTLRGIDCEDLTQLRDAPPLESLTLKGLAGLTSLQGLEAVPALQKLTLSDCPALVTLRGLEGARHLTELLVSECDQLADFTAMAGLRSLEVFPRWTHRNRSIELTGFGPFEDIAFVEGLHAAQAIALKLRGPVDLAPLTRMPRLQDLRLEVDGLAMAFSSLVNVRCLAIEFEAGSDTAAAERHEWHGELAQLESLRVQGGAHAFAQLRAPALTSFTSWWARLPDLRGVSHARELVFTLGECESLDGLEASAVPKLDLRYTEQAAFSGSLSVLHQMPLLQAVQIGTALTQEHQKELAGLAQIESLDAQGYSGSLAFLQGWNSLTHLDLRNAGELRDIEVLCSLPALVRVRLRGAALKRDGWPKALQDRIDFQA